MCIIEFISQLNCKALASSGRETRGGAEQDQAENCDAPVAYGSSHLKGCGVLRYLGTLYKPHYAS